AALGARRGGRARRRRRRARGAQRAPARGSRSAAARPRARVRAGGALPPHAQPALRRARARAHGGRAGGRLLDARAGRARGRHGRTPRGGAGRGAAPRGALRSGVCRVPAARAALGAEAQTLGPATGFGKGRRAVAGAAALPGGLRSSHPIQPRPPPQPHPPHRNPAIDQYPSRPVTLPAAGSVPAPERSFRPRKSRRPGHVTPAAQHLPGRARVDRVTRPFMPARTSCPRGYCRRNCSPPGEVPPMASAQAAVLNAVREPLSVEPLAVRDPRDGEVLVRLGASGVCHSDLHAITGDLPMPLPCVLGHEGAGVVEAVGAGVQRVKPKDHVVLNWVPFCGSCWYCNSGNAYLCEMGDVGLNVIQGAVLAGANPIIAIDLNERKLGFGKQFGATHTVNAGSTDPVSAVLDLTGMRGADYAFEVIGRPEVVTQAFMAVRRGGKAVVVGVPPATATVSVPGMLLPLAEKSLVGSLYGSANMARDVPRLIDLYRAGKLKLDELITRRYKIAQVSEAFAAMEKGEVARGVITF